MKRAPLPSPSALLVSAALFAAFSQGCGKAAPEQNSRFPAHSLQEAQRLAQQAQLSCVDARECPLSVGLLTIASPDNTSMCTTFVIAPGLMATNNHCIPDDLKRAGSDCSGRLWVTFADVPGTQGEQVGCKSIVQAGFKPGLSDPDYAFFRLDHALTRPPLAVSHRGFADGAQFWLDKVNPTSKTAAIGLLERVRCKTPQRTLITPQFDSDLAPLATIADCELVHGNSGSPLLDDEGKIRGIVQETVLADEYRKDLDRRHITLFDNDLAPLGVATNFACVRLANEPATVELPSGCGTPGPSESPEWRKNSQKEGLKLVYQWNSSATPATVHLDWSDATAIGDTDTFTVTPHCFKPDLQWMDTQLAAQILDVDLPVWTVKTGVNRYLQTDYRSSLNPQALHAQLRFSPAQLRDMGQSAITLSASQTLFDGAIPVCR